jgi:peptide-methionine (R)-S-oxide reductase
MGICRMSGSAKAAVPETTRRGLLALAHGLALSSAFPPTRAWAQTATDPYASSPFRRLSTAQWRARLGPGAFLTLRQQATERPFSSPLLSEQRPGTYACAGCGLTLFRSQNKYDSGTGWPTFSRAQPGVFGFAMDRSQGMVRTEYHCACCLGHHGHLFDDGPPPTHQRWCSNGVALTFRAA